MRLSRARIDALSLRLATSLLNKKLIACDRKAEGVAATIAAVIKKEMEIEDRLDQEVEALMKKYEREMRGEQVDAHVLFQMIKKQLVKERNIIL